VIAVFAARDGNVAHMPFAAKNRGSVRKVGKSRIELGPQLQSIPGEPSVGDIARAIF